MAKSTKPSSRKSLLCLIFVSPDVRVHYPWISDRQIVSASLPIFPINSSNFLASFCPSLKALSKVFRMNENIAGVTLLAFGNGSPDIFSSITQLSDVSVGKIYTEVMSGCMFVSILISGIILIVKPFALCPATFLRDSLFLLGSLLFIEYCIDDGYFSLTDGICTMCLYFTYISVVCIDQFLLSYTEKKLRTQLRNFNIESDNRLSIDSLNSQLDLIQSELEMDYGLDRRMSFAPQKPGKNYLLSQFYDSLKPFDFDEFKGKGILGKAMDIFCAPVTIILAIFIPLVDLDEERNGWSKLLNCIQWVTFPLILIVCLKWFDDYVVIGCLLGCGALVGAVVFKTSGTYSSPGYHFVSMIWKAN